MKKLISYNPNRKGSVQHIKPCSDCPWRRDSLNGWLGGESAENWALAAHSEQTINCHVIGNMQCAGIATYRRNVCKRPRPPNLVVEADREKVFASPQEFLDHHSKVPSRD